MYKFALTNLIKIMSLTENINDEIKKAMLAKNKKALYKRSCRFLMFSTNFFIAVGCVKGKVYFVF